LSLKTTIITGRVVPHNINMIAEKGLEININVRKTCK